MIEKPNFIAIRHLFAQLVNIHPQFGILLKKKKDQYQLGQMQKKGARWIESNWDYETSATSLVQNLGLNSLAIRKEIARHKMLHTIYYNQKVLLDSAIRKHASNIKFNQ